MTTKKKANPPKEAKWTACKLTTEKFDDTKESKEDEINRPLFL